MINTLLGITLEVLLGVALIYLASRFLIYPCTDSVEY